MFSKMKSNKKQRQPYIFEIKKDKKEYYDTRNFMFSLELNTPNPFKDRTEIKYIIPKNFIANSKIEISDSLGKTVKIIDNLPTGIGKIILENNFSTKGLYFYTLVINGIEVATYTIILD